ncbi:carbamate kinase [Herbaspirillum sp. RTI4]|uniref:carbamate kinase n=1 Tax=Herbaspirillum sp. RTI4 TaxID=3048640 RepID=UPI002AB3FFAC|nr:carbamate kinase [Herbaspirillum sp. RTI4]MDY7578658.1 carbamate kinase [Herbaspirillum sp. RTI4]MEA9980644.1 carbamate kinase [Herbaspirillum sp. RTI4]
MRIVVALGGNALLKPGEAVSAVAQRRNLRIATAQLAKMALSHELAIVHGNGPQVGLLALQEMSRPVETRFSLDVLDAETEGMIGYLIEQELRNSLPAAGYACATLLTMVEVSRDDPAFGHPDKPIGPVYTEAEATAAMQVHGWTMVHDGGFYRRTVPSPAPVRILQLEPVRWLLERGSIVICAGGGGIPVLAKVGGGYQGVEAVVDKDRSAALLACEIDADLLLIATDVEGVFLDWAMPARRLIRQAHPDDLAGLTFPAGTMGPKVEAACAFAKRTGRRAVIGALNDIERMCAGSAGTLVSCDQSGIAAD